MKRTILVFYIFLTVIGLGCSKKSVDAPEEVATKFPAPAWKADETGKYASTMTAVVTLPATLAVDGDVENDKLAAFVNNECRGVGVIVKVNNQNLFFVLIQGLPDESNKITFKYFSNKTSYMYESGSALNFLVDAVYGTAQNPKTLELTRLK
jgi:hypothetical protein